MGKIKSLEINDVLLEKINKYIKENGYTFSEFIRMCVRSFLSKIEQPKSDSIQKKRNPKKSIKTTPQSHKTSHYSKYPP